MRMLVADSESTRKAEIRRLRALYRFVESSSRTSAIEQVYEAALTAFVETTVVDRAAILLFDEDGVVRFKASRGLSPKSQAALTGPPWARGAREAHNIIASDVLRDPSLAAYRAIFEHEGIRTLVLVPLALEGGVLGKVMLYYAEPHECTREELEAVRTLGALLSAIAQRKQLEIDSRKQAERECAVLLEQSQRAQKELERTNEDLRRANRALEAFAYSASHDLKEPLRTIAISAQLVERGGALRGEDATHLSNIFNAAQRMDILIRDVLAYTQAAKEETGSPPAVDSVRVLAAVLQSLHGFIEEAGAIVTSGSLPAVTMHENQLARLFQNLIDNAIKYRGKEIPRVHITAQERGGWCVFSVADNGIGIEPQYAERIFELFKRLHTRDRYPGSGFGLAICQRVVEQAGGRIWLEQSTPGRGSTFCFALPASNT